MKSVYTQWKCVALTFLLALEGYSQSQGPLSGTIFTNVGIPGSTSTWGNPANAALSDNNRAINTINLAQKDDYTDYVQVTGYGFTVPSNALIQGIQVEVERSDPGSNIKDYRVRIVKNGVIKTQDKSANQAWPNTDAYRAYGGATDLWGETWTPADVNASDFGVAIAAYRQGGGMGAGFGRIDHIRITVYYSSLLPITLSDFHVIAQADQAQLSWTTSSEVNNHYFSVERSIDAVQFYSLGDIKGAGTSYQYQYYTFTDAQPVIGTNYYRIKQVDYDGTFTYSSIISMEYAPTSVVKVFDIYPEGISSSTLLLQVDGMFGESLTIQIADMQGRLHVEGTKWLSSASSTISLNLPAALPRGVYIVHLFNGNRYQSRKIVWWN